MSNLMAKCPCCGGQIAFDSNADEVTCPACKAELIAAALNAAEESAHTYPHSELHEHPPLTEEEREHELKRKEEFKQELKETVKRIDELHERRPVLEKQRKSIRGLAAAGVIAALISLLLFISERAPTREVTVTFVIACVVVAVALLMLILSFVRRARIIKQQDKLEAEMKARKEKRDILIGRLNKINSRLHKHQR